MTQLGMGVAALNHDSKFQAAYEKGMKKTEYWQPTLEDCLDLISKLPTLAARIYRNVYHPENPIPPIDKNLDLVGNYSNMMGYGSNKNLTEYLRLYIALHGDHEGGNASAHTARMFRVCFCCFVFIFVAQTWSAPLCPTHIFRTLLPCLPLLVHFMALPTKRFYVGNSLCKRKSDLAMK